MRQGAWTTFFLFSFLWWSFLTIWKILSPNNLYSTMYLMFKHLLLTFWLYVGRSGRGKLTQNFLLLSLLENHTVSWSQSKESYCSQCVPGVCNSLNRWTSKRTMVEMPSLSPCLSKNHSCYLMHGFKHQPFMIFIRFIRFFRPVDMISAPQYYHQPKISKLTWKHVKNKIYL